MLDIPHTRRAEESPQPAARILIADDTELVRDSVAKVVSSHRNWEVCGQATNGRDAVAMAAAMTPDLIVIDLLMPELDGLSAAKRILSHTPQVPIILFTMIDGLGIRSEAERIGCVLVPKSGGAQPLLDSIEQLLASEHPSPEIPAVATTNPLGIEPALPAGATILLNQTPAPGQNPDDDLN